MRRLAAMLLILAAACSDPVTGPEATTTFTSRDGNLTIRYPESWTLIETSAFDVTFSSTGASDNERSERAREGETVEQDGEFRVDLVIENDIERTTVEGLLAVSCSEGGSVAEVIECEQRTQGGVPWAWIHTVERDGGSTDRFEVVAVRGTKIYRLTATVPHGPSRDAGLLAVTSILRSATLR